MKQNIKPLTRLTIFLSVIIGACNSGGVSDNAEKISSKVSVDITNAIFTEQSSDCATFSEDYSSAVLDIQNNTNFEGSVRIDTATTNCTMTVNGIPNHNFNDESARFATRVSEQGNVFTLPRSPQINEEPTALSQQSYNAIMLNGVVLDLLSAGCYKPNDNSANADGNVSIGCRITDGWLLDPLGTESRFGADSHNAHTQPDGTYHYHGNPMAMFDDNPGSTGSPVIGFASDGFPIYGSYFLDPKTNEVRKATSSYALKSGERPGRDDSDPGGEYDGMYIDDYEYCATGDLDSCNGMTVNGQYGYYVTDSYPWVMACHVGTPNPSFSKGMPKAVADHEH